MNIISIDNLKKRYSNHFTLDIPSVSIDKGSIVGLVGNNGAGKTTFLRLLLDLLRPDTGKIILNGIDISNSDQWRSCTSCFLDDGFLLDYLAVSEFLSFKASVYHMSDTDYRTAIARWKRLFDNETDIAGKLIKNLSTGNRQKVGIISAVMLSPEILVLDEPFNYLDPSSQYEVMSNLKELNKRKGTTILFSSHNLDYVAELSSRILLMENGSIKGDFNTSDADVLFLLKGYFRSQYNVTKDGGSTI